MKKLLLITAALAICASSAFAATPGVNLIWGKCSTLAAGGQNFANPCDGLGGGLKVLQGDFRAANAINDFAACDGVIDIGFSTNTPDFWKLASGGCNAGAMATTTPGIVAVVCPTSLYDASTFGSLVYENPTPSRLRVRVTQVNGGAPSAVIAGQMYPGVALSMDMDAGAACAGCADPACLVLNNITVSGFITTEVESISATDVRNFTTYNGGAVGGAGCPAATPSHNSTWGQVKSLYR